MSFVASLDWKTILEPVVATLLVFLIGIFVAYVSGLVKWAQAFLISHKQASAAAALGTAWNIVQGALTTGASTIAGKVQRGELDWTNKPQMQAAAEHEVAEAESRVGASIATVNPAAGALVASLMAKVDSQVVASPTIGPAVVTIPNPANA